MTTREVILERAAELLAASTSGDISTRAVCEAAGVTQPVLYRLFGDKDGLLVAVVDHVWEQYLSMKRAAVPSADPLRDLFDGWDSHLEFALTHPHAYRLLFGSGLTGAPEAAAEAMRILQSHLERLAAQGRLAVQPAAAARMVMAANSGLALGLLLRPTQFPDRATSTALRDTLYRGLLLESPPVDATVVAATTLRSVLADDAARHTFTPGEAGLLDEWLSRVQAGTPSPTQEIS